MQDSLAHYGVKGMKWGQSKANPLRRRTPVEYASRQRTREKVVKGTVVAMGVSYAALAYGKPLMDIGLVHLATANNARKAAAGAAAANAALRGIGANPVIALAKGVDGVFR